MAATEHAAGGARRTRQRERQETDAPPTGSGAVRGELERRPHDPFEVDVAAVLEELTAEWGFAYCIAHVNGKWRAARIDGTGPILTADTPDELRVLILADWGPR